jgi:hypothetical protein
MEYAEKWCKVCGQALEMCKHDTERTKDAEEALRIRQIYLGIEIEPGNRTEK